ncbi:MAG: aspartate aminotransferase family protein [Bacteroidetes bacterium]|nr:aspartate aminotransferase family protein [Bacteroidota bacterium]
MQLSLRQLFLRHQAQTSPAPMALEVVSAEGIYLYGANGEKWMDMISGISVSNVGHRHPHVLKAINNQLEKYMHLMVYGEYILSPQVLLAQKLAGLFPPLDSVYFVNSGAEAIEGAIKLSRRATGRSKIFSFKNAYHGSTTGALSLMSSDYFTSPFQPLLPHVHHLNPGDLSALEFIDQDTAAVFVEIIRGEAGAELVDRDFLQALRVRCTETEALFVADEIQTGFGRTGDFFACQGEGIIPDIVVMAKGMGGGMPIGAFMSTAKIMSALSDNPVLGHITTFGGHPVCCAAALANIEVIESIDIKSRVSALEKIARDLLIHPGIKSISGRGLLLAIDFGEEHIAHQVISKCVSLGVITDWFLFAPQKLRLCPPLIITDTEMETACKLILNAIEKVYTTENE